MSTSSALPFKAISGPGQHWLKGNLGQFDTTKVHDFFYDTARQYGHVSRIRFMHKHMLVIQNADTVQSILKNRPDRFRRARVMETMFKEMGIHGVFSAEGPEWRNQRLLMNPAFKPSRLKYFFPKIEEITHRLVQRLEKEKGDIDIQSIFMSYTVDVTSSLAFGTDVNTLQTNDTYLQDHLNIIFPMLSYRLRAPFPYWRLFRLKRDKKLDHAIAQVKGLVFEFISSARASLKNENRGDVEEAQNLLEAMILSKNENGESFSEEELFGNVVTLLLAGEDTTANTLSWVIDFLADDQKLQQRLYDEVRNAYPAGSSIQMAELDKCPLLSGVIHETMRLKPVAPYVYIEPIQDEVIEGHHCPAGTILVCLLSGEGFNEDLFPDCEKFNPQRWLDIDEKTLKLQASKLLPFGYGNRLCPGRQLSLVEMRLSLIELIRRFEFSRSQGSKSPEAVVKFTLQPEGLRVDLRERTL